MNIQSKSIVLQNHVFNELIEHVCVRPEELFGPVVNVEEVVAFLTRSSSAECLPLLQVSPQSSHGYTKVVTQLLLEKWIDITIHAGFFNEEKTEVYFLLEGYASILEFIRFKNSISKIPENIALLELNDELSFYGGNESFEKTFSTPALSFADKYSGSFAAAMCEEHRKNYLALIQESVISRKKCSFVIEIYTAAGLRHYAFFNARPLEDMLNHTLLCATVHLVDDNVEEYMTQQKAIAVYNTAFEFSQSVAFYLTLSSMHAEFYGSLADNFRLKDIDEDFITYAKKKNLIYSDDLSIFEDMMFNIQNGVERDFRIRINATDGRHDWYMVVYKIQRDAQGNPIAALGKVSNIQLTQELQTKADTDLLTGCLNKGAFEMNVRSLFQGGTAQSHAFLIVDVDNFKEINDNLGHFFGDIVLKEIASKLRRIFRQTDLVARIGGDEFAVLMCGVDDLAVVERKAKEIIKALDITYKGNNSFYRITASVGISLSPQDSYGFEQMYKNADIALYSVKAKGKNSFVVYAPNMNKGTMENRTPINLASRAISAHFNQEIAMEAFNLLFESKYDSDSLDALLRHLGAFYHVDRCYVFEINSTEPDCYDNTYEWCAEGIAPQRHLLQKLPLSAFQETFDMSDEDGVYYCNDIDTVQSKETRETLAMQGIQSVVLTFVKRNGRVEYVLGFDDCTSKRVWKPMEISTLTYTSKIIAQYLLYKRAISYEVRLSQEKTTVLDSLSFYAYIIDNSTYELMYFNGRTKKSFPSLQVGDICYKSLRGLDEPCQDCPLRTLKEHPGAKRVRMLIHNDPLNVDVLVTSSYLEQFTGRPCMFVSSSNIDDIVKHTNITEFDRELFTSIEYFDMDSASIPDDNFPQLQ